MISGASGAARRQRVTRKPSHKGAAPGWQARGKASWRWPRLELAPLLILLGAAILRLAHLGYSHFQGDEIKALYPQEAAFPDFLFIQKKGPVQFLVTLAMYSIAGEYREWVVRLPFSLASLLSVYVLYRLVLGTFGRSTALISAALFGWCGLIVVLGRIAQYQSFCILFVLLTAHFLCRSRATDNPMFLYPALFFYALALLTHYDALPFAPTLGLLLAAGHRGLDHNRGRAYLKHLTAASVVGLALVGLFYIPYVLRPTFPIVQTYLLARVASGAGAQTFASTYALLGLYLPPFYLAVTIPLLVCGVVAVLQKRRDISGLGFLFWFFSVFGFYMLLGGDPRSHVYNFFLPGFVLVAVGLEWVVGLAKNHALERALRGGLWVLLVAFGVTTYYMVVDHTVEHPWYRKTIFGYPLPNLEARSIEGVMGFPYHRGLQRVGELFHSGRLKGSYFSNERDVMAEYYFAAPRASTPDYYIYVYRPQSLDRHLPAFVDRYYRRVREISAAGRTTIDIYESPLRAGQFEESP